MTRKQISTARRFEIFKRDNFTCQYCGAHPPSVILHVDHINPVILGGGNTDDNLITSCSDCNLGKAARPLTLKPKFMAESSAEVKEREKQIAGYSAAMEAAYQRLEEDVWRVAEELKDGARKGYSRANFASIKRFINELGVHETLEAAELANTRKWRGSADAFKYFCGICWNKIKDRK